MLPFCARFCVYRTACFCCTAAPPVSNEWQIGLRASAKSLDSSVLDHRSEVIGASPGNLFETGAVVSERAYQTLYEIKVKCWPEVPYCTAKSKTIALAYEADYLNVPDRAVRQDFISTE